MSEKANKTELWREFRKADYERTVQLLERPYVVRERLAYFAILSNGAGFAVVVNQAITLIPIDSDEQVAIAFLLVVLFAGIAGSAQALMEIANACSSFARKLRAHLLDEALSGAYRDATDLGNVVAGKRSALGITIGALAPVLAVSAVLFGWIDISS